MLLRALKNNQQNIYSIAKTYFQMWFMLSLSEKRYKLSQYPFKRKTFVSYLPLKCAYNLSALKVHFIIFFKGYHPSDSFTALFPLQKQKAFCENRQKRFNVLQ